VVTDPNLIRDGRHYDALKTQDDVPFYLARAQAAAGPVLEIGCGTGRVTLPLASAGVEIVGLDVSAPMLAEARRKADAGRLRIEWIEADARHLDLGRRFALIILPFNTLQFFRDLATLGRVFDGITRHLDVGGRLIFDVFNPQVTFLASDPSRRYERARYPDPDGGGEVVLEETRAYLADRQVVRSTRYYHVGERRDASVSSLDLRCFFPCELDLIVEHFGFDMESKFGTFSGEPFSGPSPKQVCVCQPHAAERVPQPPAAADTRGATGVSRD
jgi:Methylase involved in ubiquinone/menaquinone biosynthesis